MHPLLSLTIPGWSWEEKESRAVCHRRSRKCQWQLCSLVLAEQDMKHQLTTSALEIILHPEMFLDKNTPQVQRAAKVRQRKGVRGLSPPPQL